MLDELVAAGVLHRQRRDGIEYPIWSTVRGLAVLTGQGPLCDAPTVIRQCFEELTLAFTGQGCSEVDPPNEDEYDTR